MKHIPNYPNPDFTPVTTHTPDGILVAYDAVSAIWASLDGLFFKQDRHGSWTRRTVTQLRRQKRYGSRTRTGARSGDSYPHIDNFRVHKIMARAWIGPQPSWLKVECDHINGNILDWRADNIQWVSPQENHRRAKILRSLRKSGFDPTAHTPAELLALVTDNNVAGDVYEEQD